MSFLPGGDTDKRGNAYEYDFATNCFIKVLYGEIKEFTYEPISKIEETGIDIRYVDNNKISFACQCKARNGEKDHWRISDLYDLKVIKYWTEQEVDYDYVSLVSPLQFLKLTDICNLALACDGDYKLFNVRMGKKGKDAKNLLKQLTIYLEEIKSLTDSNKDQYVYNYLLKIKLHQESQESLKKNTIDHIRMMFVDDAKSVYAIIYNLVSCGELFGKKIDASIANYLLKEHLIKKRIITNDSTLVNIIDELNVAFKEASTSFLSGFYRRIIDDNIKEILEKDSNNIVLVGNGGSGKSSCLMNIISDLEKNKIPYLAIKLDTNIPSYSPKEYGKKLGLPESPVKCLDAISSKYCYLIFDQLDTLKWNRYMFKECLQTMQRLINEIISINNMKNYKVRVILACRENDLKDSSIQQIVKSLNARDIQIPSLSVQDLNKLVGENCLSQMNSDLIQCLKNPICLYIWLKNPTLKIQEYNVKNFIESWENEICNNAKKNGLSIENIKKVKKAIVNRYLSFGELSTPYSFFDEIQEVDFLISEGYIYKNSDEIKMFHQIVLDNALIEKMFNEFKEGKSIHKIVGDINHQDLKQKYIFSNFLEKIKDLSNFTDVCYQLLHTSKLRYSFKISTLEVIYAIPKKFVKSYVDLYLKLLKEDDFKIQTLNICVSNNSVFMNYLAENNLLEELYINDIDLYKSIFEMNYHNLSDDFYKFIESKLLFDNYDKDKLYIHFFGNDCLLDSLYKFELRKKIFLAYESTFSNCYINLQEICKKDYCRFVDLIDIAMQLSQKNDKSYRNDHLDAIDTLDLSNMNHNYTINKLLHYIPSNISYAPYDWKETHHYGCSYKRLTVQLLKESFSNLMNTDYELFQFILSPFYSKGNSIYNEIILSAFSKASISRSNDIISILLNNIKYISFEETSGRKTKLDYLCEVLEKHLFNANQSLLIDYENAVYKFMDDNIRDEYLYRKKWRKESIYGWNSNVFGDFQEIIYKSSVINIFSQKSKELKRVIGIRIYNKYIIYDSHFGSVSSPVASKKLSFKNWTDILLNPNIIYGESRKWKEVPGGFIESSIEEFSLSFEKEALNDPNIYIDFFISNTIDHHYQSALLRAMSETTGKLDSQKAFTFLEKMKIENYDFYVLKKLLCKEEMSAGNANGFKNKMIKLFNDYVLDTEKYCDKDEKNDYSFMSFDENSTIGGITNVLCALVRKRVLIESEIECKLIQMRKCQNQLVIYNYCKILYAFVCVQWDDSKYIELLSKVAVCNHVLGVHNDFYKLVINKVNHDVYTMLKKYQFAKDEYLDSRYFAICASIYKSEKSFFNKMQIRHFIYRGLKNNANLCCRYFISFLKEPKNKEFAKNIILYTTKLDDDFDQIYYLIIKNKYIDIEKDYKFVCKILKEITDKCFIKLLDVYSDEIGIIINNDMVTDVFLRRIASTKIDTVYFVEELKILLGDIYYRVSKRKKLNKKILNYIDELYENNYVLANHLCSNL